MSHAIERPVPNSFFPATRIGLAVGFVVAVAGAAMERAAPPEGAPAAVVEAAAPGVDVAFPLHGPAVVHVWLENCADCMSAFRVHKELVDDHIFDDLPEINVSYGYSSPEFRAKYGVDKNYIADVDGSQVVQRYGISSFTTLVIDRAGAVVLRDRPDTAGYIDRVRHAWVTLLGAGL